MLRAHPVRTLAMAMCLFAHGAQAGMVSVSSGAWNVYQGHGDVMIFSKLTTSVYMALLETQVAVEAPIALTARFAQGKYADSRFAPGDLSFYVGKTLGSVQPRVGMVVPLFYETGGEWIGSGNIKIRAGIGLRSFDGVVQESGFSAEVMSSVSVNNPRGLLAFPSTDLSIDLKQSFRMSDRVLVGVALYLGGKYARWKNWRTSYDNSQVQEWGWGAMPTVYGQLSLNSRWFVSLKAGTGPGFKVSSEQGSVREARGSWSASSNLSVAGNYYF